MVGRIIHRNITLQQNVSRHFLFQDDTAKMKAKPMANLIIRIQDWDVGKPTCFQLGPNPWCEQGRLFLAGHPSALNMRLLFIMPEVSVSLLCRCVHTRCVCLLTLQHAHKSKTLVLQSKIVMSHFSRQVEQMGMKMTQREDSAKIQCCMINPSRNTAKQHSRKLTNSERVC